MMQDVGAKTVAVFNTTDDSGLTTADSLIAEAEKVGIKVLTRQQSDPNDTDYSAQVAAIVSSGADVVYMSCSGNTNGQFVRQARQGGWDGLTFSKEPLATFMIETAGVENSNYVAFAYPYVTYNDLSECNIPIMSDFLEKYQAEFNKLVTAESGYRSWDAMMVLWEASKIAGSNDSDALREATNKVVIDGLGGKIDFTLGNREGYSKGFNSFILVDEKNILWSDWVASGGHEAFKQASGRSV